MYTRVNSPFKKIIGFGWYGGLTAGVLQCSVCSREYKFQLIARDDGLSESIFSLAEVPSGTLEEVVGACRSLGDPDWPVWVPAAVFPDAESEDKTHQAVNSLKSKAGAQNLFLVMSRLYDAVLAATRMERPAIAEVIDWFSQFRQRSFCAW